MVTRFGKRQQSLFSLQGELANGPKFFGEPAEIIISTLSFPAFCEQKKKKKDFLQKIKKSQDVLRMCCNAAAPISFFPAH